ncbi:MAG TPA: ABC transporter permease [Herpetosiphonaceae bacterium]
MSWLSNANPVLVKELRGRMRGARAFIILTVFLLILAVPTVLIYLSVAETVRYDPFSAGQYIGKSLFIGIVSIALIQIMIVVPGQAASAITSEKESETYDLLISTLLPPWKIILGKLVAALAYALLLIVAVIPFMAVSFLFGGVTIQEFLLALLGLFVTVMLFGSIGILWSVIMRRSLAATIVTQATSVVVLLGIPFLLAVFAILFLSRSTEPLWASSRAFLYLWTMFLSLHPFIALGSSELLLADGQTGLFFPVAQNTIPFIPVFDRNGALQNFMLPQPWLIYTIEAVVLSAVLVFFSIRLLRPLDDRPRRRRRK